MADWSPEAVIATAGAAGTAIGAAITLTVSQIIRLMQARAEIHAKDQEPLVKEQQDAIKRLEAAVGELKGTTARQDGEIERLRQEVADAQQAEHECQVLAARQEARITYLEDKLVEANIGFKPWNPEGSDVHRPLNDRRRGRDPGYRGPERRKKEEE